MLQTKDLDWEAAYKHFKEVRQRYIDLENMQGCNTSLALLITFKPLDTRFKAGERTQELYYEMLEVE